MASLMENLIEVMNKENEEYEILVGLSKEKTPIIIKGDIDGLALITEKEQDVVSRIQKLEKKRIEITRDIANVTNKSEQDVNLSSLIKMMEGRPKEKNALTELHDKLKITLQNMKIINDRNRELIQNSLDMVEFEMNLLQSMKKAPETADYNKSAYSVGNIMGSGTKRFDAKQ